MLGQISTLREKCQNCQNCFKPIVKEQHVKKGANICRPEMNRCYPIGGACPLLSRRKQSRAIWTQSVTLGHKCVSQSLRRTGAMSHAKQSNAPRVPHELMLWAYVLSQNTRESKEHVLGGRAPKGGFLHSLFFDDCSKNNQTKQETSCLPLSTSNNI